MRKLILLLCFMGMGFGAVGEQAVWSQGMTLLSFLESQSLPLKLYYNLANTDKELASEVQVGSVYYTLHDDTGKVLQVLIPVSEDLQMHIYHTKEGYSLDFIPIVATKVRRTLALSIQKSVYQDLLDKTQDPLLAAEAINVYKKSINLKKFVLKNDSLALIYERKYRLGKAFSTPQIKAMVIETNAKPNYIFAFDDSFYNPQGREVIGFLLDMPVKYRRISSYFSYGRFHPILRKTRPHYGVDFAAPYGTPIRAAASGRVVYSGNKGGYGNVIEINHGDGIRTLYGHMSRYIVSAGAFVKKGQTIGYVGNTGLSTGPHLHFGVYKNNHPMNPLGIIAKTKKELKGYKKLAFLKESQLAKKELDELLAATKRLAKNAEQ